MNVTFIAQYACKYKEYSSIIYLFDTFSVDFLEFALLLPMRANAKVDI